MWHIISIVTGQLTERNQLQRIFENTDSIESNKNITLNTILTKVNPG